MTLYTVLFGAGVGIVVLGGLAAFAKELQRFQQSREAARPPWERGNFV